MPDTIENTPSELAKFADLGLPPALLDTLAEVGYETPSPIQSATIPPLLAGRDALGQAQTGTGKTAAFALPILARLDLAKTKPQALVLAPTRALAIQVPQAFQRYPAKLPGYINRGGTDVEAAQTLAVTWKGGQDVVIAGVRPG